MKTKTKGPKYRSYHAVPASYSALCAEWLPRPIHDDDALAEATAMIDALAGFPLNDEQEDYLDAVSHFVMKYEGDVDPVLSGLDLLRNLAAENGLTGADISRALGGSRTLGPMILRGERSITAEHARSLGAHFRLDPGAFLKL